MALKSRISEFAPALLQRIQATQQAEPMALHVEPPDMAARIADLEADGNSLEAVVEELMALVDATPRTTGPAFYNQLFGGRDDAAVLGEIVAAMLNNSMYTYKVAGPWAIIEKRLIDHMASKVGWDACDGVFNPGGSLSNLAAMVLARNATEPDARNQGLSGQPLTVYTSAEGHYSIPKNAGMIGIGRHNVCEVPTNDDGTMKVDALAEMIAKDRARGCTPMMINATAGTTVMGAFDPIDAIADVAEREGVWLHVDGAFGATLLLSPEHRDLMAGIERAHSVTWNAHKMMGVPLSCSVLLTRRLGQLTRQIGEGADYLFQSDCDDVNYGTRSIQCGRRNDVIKLWAAWRHHGDAGYASRIARQFELTSYAASIIRRADDMTLSCEPQSLTVCFEVDGCDSAAICDLLDRESLAMVGHGLVNGRRVIRIVCVNPEQTEADLDEFFANVRDVASRLPATEGQTPARLS